MSMGILGNRETETETETEKEIQRGEGGILRGTSRLPIGIQQER